MPLPVPNLDDRRFQELVDDAKRLVQQRCPEWTDHNVSDPGVTLIETFAFMVDQLLYRLNRVPDRTYLKFLDLIGLRLFPPTAARLPVTFWLTAGQPETVVIPSGTRVATVRTDTDEAVEFDTLEDLRLPPIGLLKVVVSVDDDLVEQTDELNAGHSIRVFGREGPPQPGDTLYMGLTDAAPACAVRLRFSCLEGVGVDPEWAPIRWEAWDGQGWVACEVGLDSTGGLNQTGELVIHVPPTHTAHILARQRAGWLRCRVTPLEDRQPPYLESPMISTASAETAGGTVQAVHAERVADEIIGISEGVAGQRFPLQRFPVVPSDEPLTLEVAAGDGWESWTEVEHFADSGPEERHFIIDRVTGELILGPAVREPDGTIRHFGAVPPKGAPLCLPLYRVGGGRQGNVAAGTVTVLLSSIPYISGVINRVAGIGGVDGETIDEAKARGPILLRTRNRAVTVEDYQHLARQAAPEAARVRCIPITEGADEGAVRILVVPQIEEEPQTRLRLEQLVPADETLTRIRTALDERRVVGSRLTVGPPFYQGVTVVATVRARPRARPDQLRAAALDALYRYYDPVFGGPDGTGWPFGRPVQTGETYAVLQRVPFVELVEEVRVYGANPLTGERGPVTSRLELNPHALVFSYEHQVQVVGV
jgi:predicted phage baseplate assembly protein